MQIKSKNFHWEIIRKNIYCVCIVFAMLCGLSNEGKTQDLGFWIFPVRQSSFEIDITKRSEQIIDIDIKRRCVMGRCPVSFGIEFASKRGASKSDSADPVKNDQIKEYFFISRPGQLDIFRFPLHARVKLLNAKSKIIFDETKHIGANEHFYWGGATITAILGGGSYCLPSGKHKAIVQVNQADQGIQEFSVKLVVLNEFKIWCKD